MNLSPELDMALKFTIVEWPVSDEDPEYASSTNSVPHITDPPDDATKLSYTVVRVSPEGNSLLAQISNAPFSTLWFS
jgi:hypothetical protein